MSKVRWGIIGAGRIAGQFSRDIAFSPSAELVAVAARELNRAQVFATAHGGLRPYGGYAELLDDPDVDAVYIATPHAMHLSNGLDAIAAGKAVLCEKPLTLNPVECRELCAAANRAGVYLMEAMWTWFLPAIRQAKTWVEEGRIGDIVQIKADFGYSLPYDPDQREWDVKLGGGSLLEMGVYPVAFERYFAPGSPDNIQVAGRRAPNGADADLTATLQHGERVSTISSSFLARLPNWGHVIGTDGYIAIPDFFRAQEASLHHLDERREHFKDDRKGAGFEFEIEAASRDILQGRTQSSIVSHADSQAFQDRMADILRRL